MCNKYYYISCNVEYVHIINRYASGVAETAQEDHEHCAGSDAPQGEAAVRAGRESDPETQIAECGGTRSQGKRHSNLSALLFLLRYCHFLTSLPSLALTHESHLMLSIRTVVHFAIQIILI